MIIKGLDFQNVDLVGVLNADHLMNFPDFRAHERTFQMLSQVAGRAGRKELRGKVLIQTYQPHHPIIQHVINGNYDQMFNKELKDRKKYYYPPYNRLIRIVVNHSDMEILKNASHWIVNVLSQSEYGKILGPVFPPVARIRNRYRMHILVKISANKSRDQVKQMIKKTLDHFDSIPIFRSCKVNVDVDPY